MSATDYEAKRHAVRDDMQQQLAKHMLAQYPQYWVTVDLHGVAKVNAVVLLDLFTRVADASRTN